MISDRRALADPAARTLAMIVAAGHSFGQDAGRRTHSALPFGGQYSSSDFHWSNCVNARIAQIALLADQGAEVWLQSGRGGPYTLRSETFDGLSPLTGGTGTATALHRNLRIIEECAAAYVLVHVGLEVCRMDYPALLATHVASGLGATLGCVEVPIGLARDFGVVGIGPKDRVVRFTEQPARPQSLRHDPNTALVATGVLVLDRELLVDCLTLDAADRWSTHDLKRDVLPLLIQASGLAAHIVRESRVGQRPYWRELGSIDRYWRANLELLEERRAFDFADHSWPLRTAAPLGSPPRAVGNGSLLRSIISAGCVIGGHVEASVLSPQCIVRPGATVSASVLLPGVTVGTGSRVRKAVVDADCTIPDSFAIGEEAAADAACFEVSADGVVLVTAAGLARAAHQRGAGGNAHA